MPIDVTAPITDVTVYVSRARVTRRGKVTVPEGEHTLIVSPVTPRIESDSVRAGGHGAGITIRSVDVKREYALSHPDARVEALYDQQLDKKLLKQKLQDEAKSLETRLKLLEGFGVESGKLLAESISKDDTSFDKVTNTLDYVTQQLDEIRTRLRENEREQISLQIEIEAIKNKINQIQNNEAFKMNQIHIIVEASAETEFELEVSYTAEGASWTPVYDVRVTDDDVTLTYLASVQQQSEEAWDDVNLSLSTARPAGSVQLPEVQPWYLRLERYYGRELSADGNVSLYSTPAKPAEDVYFDESASEAVIQRAQPAPKVEVRQASIRPESVQSPNSTAVTYDIAGRVDIPSDGTPHQTTIAITKLGVELDYFAAPRLENTCYLRATITNTSDMTLLPGTASIFHQGEFVGKTPIRTVAPEEEFEVQLGVDDRIRIERNRTKFDVSKRLIGSNSKATYEFEITITSYLNKSAKIKIVEPFPKSTDAGIKINLLNVSPTPDEHSELNILEWTAELAKNQAYTITLSFSVEASNASWFSSIQ